MGILSLLIKIIQGFDDKSSWGYYSAIVSLLFGVFGTAPMVAIAPMIAKADWHRPIARIANMFTAAGLSSVIMIFPLIFALPPLVVGGYREEDQFGLMQIFTHLMYFSA